MVSCLFNKLNATINDAAQCEDDLKVEVFHQHRKSNSCGVLICFIGSETLFVRKKLSDNNGRVLILHVDIDDENFMLNNLYNPNAKAGELKALSN